MERERKEEEHRIAVEKRKKKAKKVFIAIASVACVCAVFLILLKTVIIPKQRINKIKTAKVGDIVYFGTYEQDNNISNGKENIKWLVLAKENNRVLVISDKALDCQPYHPSWSDVTWETCSLRKWLNSDFINSAFSDDEKSMIPTVTVSADKNPKYNTNPGNATKDKVFLLSIVETEKYFTSAEARECILTEYAISNGAWTSDSYTEGGKATCWWWLRSPGRNQSYAAGVGAYSSADEYGNDVFCGDDAVRPAMWISIDG